MALPFRCWTDQKAEYQKQTPRLGGVSQRVEKVFSPCVEQEYTVGPAGFRAQSARKPGAFLETGSFYPPPAALRLFPLLGFPAHTLHPQGVCSIRKAAQPLTAALPYRRGEFATLSTVLSVRRSADAFLHAESRSALSAEPNCGEKRKHSFKESGKTCELWRIP